MAFSKVLTVILLHISSSTLSSYSLTHLFLLFLYPPLTIHYICVLSPFPWNPYFVAPYTFPDFFGCYNLNSISKDSNVISIYEREHALFLLGPGLTFQLHLPFDYKILFFFLAE